MGLTKFGLRPATCELCSTKVCLESSTELGFGVVNLDAFAHV